MPDIKASVSNNPSKWERAGAILKSVAAIAGAVGAAMGAKAAYDWYNEDEESDLFRDNPSRCDYSSPRYDPATGRTYAPDNYNWGKHRGKDFEKVTIDNYTEYDDKEAVDPQPDGEYEAQMNRPSYTRRPGGGGVTSWPWSRSSSDSASVGRGAPDDAPFDDQW